MAGIDFSAHSVVGVHADYSGTAHASWLTIYIQQEGGQEVEVSLFYDGPDRTRVAKLAAAINRCRDIEAAQDEAEEENDAREIHDEVPF